MFARMLLLSVFVIAVGLCAEALSADDGEKPPPSEKQRQEEIRKLIAQLSAEQFKDREEAMRRLMEREEALPALREASKSEDAEVRGRAQKALETITKRQAKRALQRAIAKLKKGQTDQFVDQVVAWREQVGEDCWKATVDHVRAVNDEAIKASGGQFKLARNLPKIKPILPWVDMAKLRSVCTDHLKTSKGGFITRERIIANSIIIPDGDVQSSFLICSGSVRVRYSLGYAVVLANGNLNVGDREGLGAIVGCLVICDGDVRAAGVNDSVIVCTGKVNIGSAVDNSVIVSGGDVRMGLDFPGASAKNSLIQERQRTPLNFIHFFDPAQIGIEVKSSRNQVRVERIAAARAFGQAGVREADEIVAVNGTKVDSVHVFRRSLRRSIQETSPIILDLRREDKPLHIEVRGAGDVP